MSNCVERREWVIGAPLSRVWELTRDFTAIDKWAPSVAYRLTIVEPPRSEDGMAGCVRRVEAPPDFPGGSGSADERLLEMEEGGAHHRHTYVVVASTSPVLVGVTPTFEVLHGHDPATCRIVWSYEMPPALPPDDQLLVRSILEFLYETCISDLKKTLGIAEHVDSRAYDISN